MDYSKYYANHKISTENMSELNDLVHEFMKKDVPTYVRMNRAYLERLINDGVVSNDKSSVLFDIYSLSIIFDETIETFKLIYEPIK